MISKAGRPSSAAPAPVPLPAYATAKRGYFVRTSST
jgi:hypothetical protein